MPTDPVSSAATETTAGHAARHAESGTTYHVRFNSDVPFDRMESVVATWIDSALGLRLFTTGLVALMLGGVPWLAMIL